MEIFQLYVFMSLLNKNATRNNKNKMKMKTNILIVAMILFLMFFILAKGSNLSFLKLNLIVLFFEKKINLIVNRF